MRTLLQTVEKVLNHDVHILLLGESGVGKDFFAEAIHDCGERRAKPLVRIDCAAIPADLFEAELFGYEKGTFTDAQARKLGKLEVAHGGTVYFDDIAALVPTLQAKLLREYRWPGNVRELRNVLERALLIEEGDVITPGSLPPFDGDLLGAATDQQWTLDQLEARYIRQVLRQTRSNFSRAAAILGINRKTLLEKRKKYGIE